MPTFTPEYQINRKPVDWALSDTQLSRVHHCTRQLVSHHRKRLNAPASPEQRGGDRKSLSTGPDTDATTITFTTTKGIKRRLHQAHKACGQNLNDFMNAHLAQLLK